MKERIDFFSHKIWAHHLGKARGVSLIFEFGSLQNLAVFKLAVFEGYVFIKSVFIKKTECIYIYARAEDVKDQSYQHTTQAMIK